MTTRRPRRRLSPPAVLVTATLLVSACGSDDDADSSASEESPAVDDGQSEVTTDESGEATLGDPCELLGAAEVEAVLGVPVTGTPEGIGDGLVGSSCLWAADGAPAVSIGFTPDGAAFVDANRSSAADSGMEVVEVDVADGGFVLGDIEMQVVAGDHQVTVTRVGPVEVTTEQLEQLADAAAAAIS